MSTSTRSQPGPGSGPLFDSYVMVDWSAAAVPRRGSNSIWVAVVDRERADAPSLANPATRTEATVLLADVIRARAGRRVLIGIDVALGYPCGTAEASGWTAPGATGTPTTTPIAPWRAAWTFVATHLHDDDGNRNDRFAVAARWNGLIGQGPGPFWGCPTSMSDPRLSPRRPPVETLPRFRRAEEHLREAGLRPSSVWQLTGAGSVGSQTLTAIPVVDRLRATFPDRVEVWPFTTGFAVPPRRDRPDAVVIAETWPTSFGVDRGRHDVADAAQVLGVVAAWIAGDRRDGAAQGWFVLPETASAVDERRATLEEGWILAPPRPR